MKIAVVTASVGTNDLLNQIKWSDEVDYHAFVEPSKLNFDGITLFPNSTFNEINGYSNDYWGWGAEDDDLLHRVKSSGFEWTRKYPGAVRSLKHDRDINQEEYKKNIEKVREMWANKLDFKTEGLNTLEYEVLEEKNNEEYKMTLVRI